MKRIRHSKALGAGLMGAALLAVGSVGFSAWVITGGSTDQSSGAVGVEVAGVTDNRVTFAGNPTWNDTIVASSRTLGTAYNKKTLLAEANGTQAYICFGPSITDTTGLIQASGTGVGDLEHLKFSFSYTINCVDFSKITTFTLQLVNSTGGNATTQLLAAQGSGSAEYIKNPACVSSAVALATSSELSSIAQGDSFNAGGNVNNQITTVVNSYSEGTSASFTTDVWWGWGTAFTGDNPASQDSTNSSADATIQKINSMNDILDDITGTFTAKIVVESAA